MERKITVEEQGIYQEDYQMRMLRVNSMEKLLGVGGRGMNGKSYYDYDVSGKVSMKAMYERSKISAEDIRQFMVQFKMALQESENYLLNIHCILLDPEYIFYEDGNFYFCYYPKSQQDIWEAFHVLTEYFVREADYQDSECVRMVFLLHKETMEENYSLDKLIGECTRTEEKKEEKYEKAEYDTKEHDWITAQEMGSSILRETDNMWTPVRRFLNKHKKSKWGDWDGLYIEEEEL